MSARHARGMMKHIKILKASVAALAASMALVASGSAGAQKLEGAPRGEQYPQLFSGEDRNNNNWNDNNNWRRNKPNFQNAQRDCSRAGIREAWDRNYYSAQYDNAPKLHEGRRGWELRGRMRLHDRSGYRYVDTACEINRNDVRFEFLR